MTTPATSTQTTPALASEQASQDAVNEILRPLARLCLGQGITYAVIAEALKQVFVQEAAALNPGAPAHGTVSRISTATGLTRREVMRLSQEQPPARSMKVPVGSALFARWTTLPQYQDEHGQPLVLDRLGEAPSFEALARSLSRDVHPRSLLDELSRLGVVLYDADADKVSLTKNAFVPVGDQDRMLNLLGDNVGDHLSAAVANVLHGGSRHLEQAVFADELSAESLVKLYPLIMERWNELRDAMIPTLLSLIEEDRAVGRPQDQRIRIGVYTYSDATDGTTPPLAAGTSSKRKNHTKEPRK
jgi:hypothetical protein